MKCNGVKKYLICVMILCSYMFRRMHKIKNSICIRYNPERISKYDLRLCGEISVGKVAIIIKIFGVEF